jgi:hypothetical protein
MSVSSCAVVGPGVQSDMMHAFPVFIRGGAKLASL